MRARLAPSLAAIVIVAGMGLATYSVVRYRPWIALGYLACAVVLAAVLYAPSTWWSGTLSTPATIPGDPSTGDPNTGDPSTTRPPVAVVVLLLADAVVTLRVPAFTYLDAAAATAVRGVLAGAALAAAVLLLTPWRRAADGALAVAATGVVVAAVLLLHGDRAPAIDVWYTLQGAADSLADGRNFYRDVWVGPPGVMAAFTYLPWTAVLLAPFRWLFGDVRVGLIVATLAAAVGMRSVHRAGTIVPARAGTARAAALAAGMLLLPGTATQLEQAWTEPLLLACLVAAAAALTRNRLGWAILALGIGMACKQHLALLLPLLAVWPRFGVRRAALTALTAALAVSPWLVSHPGAMLDDTIGLLVRYPPMRFADSLYLLALNEFGWMPPFWLTGIIALGTLVLLCLRVRRTDPGPGEFLMCCALVLLVANLVNKQAFYNQYWLVAALVLLGWAARTPERASGVVRVEQP